MRFKDENKNATYRTKTNYIFCSLHSQYMTVVQRSPATPNTTQILEIRAAVLRQTLDRPYKTGNFIWGTAHTEQRQQ